MQDSANKKPLPYTVQTSQTTAASVKRRRLHGAFSSQGTMDSMPQFLKLHAAALKTLCEENITENTQTMIERFMEERDSLHTLKQKTALMDEVQTESKRLSAGADLGTGILATECTRPIPLTSTSPVTPHSRHQRSQPSPVGSFSLSQPNNKDDAASSCFHIVARFLGKRHEVAELAFSEKVKPFLPLFHETTKRIGSLQHELQQLQSSVSSREQLNLQELVSTRFDTKENSTTDNFVEERTHVARLEGKIRLWSLLADDMKNSMLASA